MKLFLPLLVLAISQATSAQLLGDVAALRQPLRRFFNLSRFSCSRRREQCQSQVDTLPIADWISQVQGDGEKATQLRQAIADTEMVDFGAILANPAGSVRQYLELLADTSNAIDQSEQPQQEGALDSIVVFFRSLIPLLEAVCVNSAAAACGVAIGGFVVFSVVVASPVLIPILIFAYLYTEGSLVTRLTQERFAMRLFFDSDCVGEYVNCEYQRLLQNIMPSVIEGTNNEE